VSGVVEFAVQRIKEELLPKFPYVDDVVGLEHSYLYTSPSQLKAAVELV